MSRDILKFRKYAGLFVVVAGAALWLLPFAVVAVGNIFNSTTFSDFVIDNFGLFIITVSPLIIFVGLIMLLVEFASRIRK